MKMLISKIWVLLVLLLATAAGADQTCCEVPDNGNGTADFPPASCIYGTPDDDMRIKDGLPEGTTIEIDATNGNFICLGGGGVGICSFSDPDCRQPGGTLGGEEECLSSTLHMPMVGTGAMSGFNRIINLQISCETHVASRTPGNPVQSFDTVMFRLQGQLPPGDPDFDLLRIVAGTDFGLPSPGHTTLTQLPGGNWSVDSFFDITYRVDFIGAPGGPLAGKSGSTTATIRFMTPACQSVPVCCVVPDNGGGTANMPPEGCSYGNPDQKKMIINGLPPGTTIEIAETLGKFSNITRYPGGSLGGEHEQFSAVDDMQMAGTGNLAGFKRNISMSVQCETNVAPRIPGAPIQSFDTEMFGLQGQLPPGDPDFDLLRLTAGTGFGLPSPGHTTLTRKPDGNWNVDSFFDITYRIDFIGKPGGPFGGMSGSTTGTIRMMTGCIPASGGQDCYNVSCGGTSQQDFSSNPIQDGFFGPGSDPFDGVIRLGGGDPGGADTIVRRLSDISLPGCSGSVTVPIELVQLNLVSCEPIVIKYYGGQTTALWNVSAALSPSLPSTGQMTVTKTHCNGGTWSSTLHVQPLLTFTRVSDHSIIGPIVGPIMDLSTVEPYRWQDTSPKPNPPCDGKGFYPADSPILMASPSRIAILELEPPQAPSQYIALDTKPQWNEALLAGTVAPMTGDDWNTYMDQWKRYLDPQTQPYPPNNYWKPELYAWDPDGVCPADPNWPDSAGLVMAWAWHDPQIPDCNYSAAWEYKYPDDPDLTNVAITVTVNPPCNSINTVSLGLKDINGNIRAWHWNVPGTLPCGVPTTITIDTSIAGPAAGSPAANGYMSNPAFDITQIVALLFDENCQWVGGTVIPPPGTTVPRAWNYWYDLLITPKPVKVIGPVKWSQPPVEINQGVILGWDEKSVRSFQPLMADDWLCKDQRPVTDIHWWGSFIGWMKPKPPQMPVAFHFGIWTDIPKDPNDPKSFSHPDKMIWEYICTSYQWNFAGYDKDPRKIANTAVTAAVFAPTVNDSCFQFNCVLPQNAWFYQKPTNSGQGRVYWLSIAAIYQTGTAPQFPWGWKTRPHYFNDDAVRIFQVQGGPWPPVIGSTWIQGRPVEYPQKISWDLAFELTTNTATVPIIVDYNADGIVNFEDFAIFANYWLETIP